MQERLTHLEAARSHIMEAKIHLDRALWYPEVCQELKEMYFEINEKVSELQTRLNKARVEAGEKEGRIWT